MGRDRVRVVSSAVAVLATAALLAGCGGGSQTATLNYYVFSEPSGSFAQAVSDCSKASGGRYKIVYNLLPQDANAQRQQLVRRLAAHDSAIDIIGMDVDWTAEFATAGWIRPWTGAQQQQVTQGVLPGPIATATWNNQIYGAPLNSNTQLLWYRKDLVPKPPTTWTEMIQDAEQLARQGKPHYIEEQGAQYEGYVVWFNSLVGSAGGQILNGNKVALGPPAQQAATIIYRLANSPAADPSLSNSKEDQARLAFEGGKAAFEINYPFVWPSAQKDAPKIAQVMGYAAFPRVLPSMPARVSIGGINLGISSYSKNPSLAFQAAACMANPQHQKVNAIKGGLPPTLASLYDDPSLAKPYPFHALIKQQLTSYGIRPQTPAYSDVSLAIQKTLSPPASISPATAVATLTSQINASLTSGALL
ncbi:MAG: ABC transporter substrate-binding protein [Solirubrobacterales bacterium]|nr:ABC transporter substrate-binding protein [Solirubrobacterales bacterium]